MLFMSCSDNIGKSEDLCSNRKIIIEIGCMEDTKILAQDLKLFSAVIDYLLRILRK